LGPVGQPDASLRHSKVEQQSVLVARRWRLSQGPAQEGRLRLGSPSLPRLARGLGEPLHDPAIGTRLADQQVLGDVFGCAWSLGEQSGGTAVASSALRAGQL